MRRGAIEAGIANFGDRVRRDIRVCVDGIVRAVNADQSLATIALPTQQVEYLAGREIANVEWVELVDCPISHPSSAAGYLVTRVTVGCLGEVHFKDFDADLFVETGEITPAQTFASHDFGDCFFRPGGNSYAKRIDPVDADVALMNINGTAGVMIVGGELRLYGSPILLNGEEVEGIPGDSPLEEKEVRRP